MLYGAIIGDIVGSIYEFNNICTKDFPFFHPHGYITDDSCMTIAVARALMNWRRNGGDLQQMTIQSMRDIGKRFQNMGYGTQFEKWLMYDDMGPYNSWGNGAAMRISSVGWMGQSIDEIKHLSHEVTVVTHNHPYAITGAEAVAIAIFLCRSGCSKNNIATYIRNNYYPLCDCVADLQDDYGWDESCQGTVPPALQCFFESESFEDAIRNAISIGGDSDTIGAITGSIAEAYYSVSAKLVKIANTYIPNDLLQIVTDFEKFASQYQRPDINYI